MLLGTAAGSALYPPSGPGRYPAGPSLVQDLANAASWPIRTRYHLFFYKVSQNARVSPKYVEKASHSPCFKNAVGKSPLDFLGFPLLLAFSHKELMGYFDPRVGFIVKMTKCRPCVPTCCTRSVRQIPPRSTAASCLLLTAPHLTRRDKRPDILNGLEI